MYNVEFFLYFSAYSLHVLYFLLKRLYYQGLCFFAGDKTRYECDVCERVVIGKIQWRAHVRGAKHKKMQKRQTLLQKNDKKEMNVWKDILKQCICLWKNGYFISSHSHWYKNNIISKFKLLCIGREIYIYV